MVCCSKPLCSYRCQGWTWTKELDRPQRCCVWWTWLCQRSWKMRRSMKVCTSTRVTVRSSEFPMFPKSWCQLQACSPLNPKHLHPGLAPVGVLALYSQCSPLNPKCLHPASAVPSTQSVASRAGFSRGAGPSQPVQFPQPKVLHPGLAPVGVLAFHSHCSPLNPKCLHSGLAPVGVLAFDSQCSPLSPKCFAEF